MRARILAVGLLATALTSFFLIFLFYLVQKEYSKPLAAVLAGAAVAGPLFGAVAGAKAERWGPLVTGFILGAVVMIVMYSMIRFNTNSPDAPSLGYFVKPF